MEFLVRFEISVPDSVSSEVETRLRSEERAMAMKLREKGILQRLWRVPGRRAVIGLWETTDATELHDVLAALPMFPYLVDVSVEPLATHPQEKK